MSRFSLKRAGWLLTLTLALGAPVAAQSRAKSFGDWICRVLKIDSAVFSRLSKVRGTADGPPAGEWLDTVDVRTGTVTPLWRCDGCWSPVRLPDGDIAVLRADGIWRVRGGKGAKVHPVENLVAALGHVDGNLVALRRPPTPAGRCEYDVVAVAMADGRVSAVDEAPPSCPEPGLLPRPDTLRGGRRLAHSSGPGAATLLLFTTLENGTEQSTPLIRAATDDGINRFDPIWLNDEVVVFVAASH